MEQEMNELIQNMISESDHQKVDDIEDMTDLRHTGYLTDDAGFVIKLSGRNFIITIKEAN